MTTLDTQQSRNTETAVLRTVTRFDIDGVLALANAGGSGLTNLPPDRDMLISRIEASERAVLDAAARESGAAIMFVVEHESRIVAISGIFPRVGAEWPFYSYRITRQANRSQAVSRLKAQSVLNLVNDFDGEAEVGMLLVDPAMRGGAFGRLAARGRYLFMAAHRNWFGRRVMAELRGWQDADGCSPVWEAIGRHFYDMEFHEADRTNALNGNQFIADLGPRYPLYISLLPATAQVALGRPHDDGQPALDMLIGEGFHVGDYVDIFDGGPTVYADIDNLRTVREARHSTFAGVSEGGKRSLVATGTGAHFRVARGTADDNGLVDHTLATALQLKNFDNIMVVPA